MTPRRPAPGTHTPGGAAHPGTPHTTSRGAAPAANPSTLAREQGTNLTTNDTAVVADDEALRAALHARVQHERARFHVTLGALKGALEEEPSPALVRAAGRRWINAAVQAIEEVAKAMQGKNNQERGQ